MKNYLILALSIFISLNSNAAESPRPDFSFSSVNSAQVIELIYSQILKTDYVLDPEVLNDQRQVSFKYSPQNLAQPKVYVARFLSTLGFSVSTRDGVDFITKNRIAEASNEPKKYPYVYTPKYRDASQLARLLSPIFKYGTFAQNRSVANPALNQTAPALAQPAHAPRPVSDGSATSMMDMSSDFLVFNGPTFEIEQLKQLLPQLDTPVGIVNIQSVLYEATTGKTEGSAIALVASILNAKLGLSFNSTTSANVNSLQATVKSGGFNAVLNVLNSDSQFKAITSPNLRIKSGSSGMLSFGQSVPTLGAISTTAVSQVQSVVYQNAGLILSLSPIVRDSSIDLKIDQQVSSFAQTTTGVNGSPTLTKRQVQTDVSLNDGEIIILGGLNQSNDTRVSVGLPVLPSFLNSNSSDSSSTELLLILQVQKVKS
jgi:general secretion pathway protein D